jgi:deazaflavin-dependent oxidoreductase (nitroreductase family)
MQISELEGLQHERVLYLTTVGRKSGLPRTIEIWFVVYQQRLYILAEHGFKAYWVRNIRVHPEVSIRIKERHFGARGRILEGVRDRHEWQAVADLSRKKYGWGDGLPVVFEILQEEEPEKGRKTKGLGR